MVFELNSIEKMITEYKERKAKAEEKAFNKKVGYASRCKVCNSEYLNQIEQLREDGYTFEEILEELEIDDISLMSLSRHFQKHYPKSQAYKEKQELEALENMREAYLKYPFLEDFFKDKDLETIEEFNTGSGFCTDVFDLCYFIPPHTVSNSNKCINILSAKQNHDLRKKKENTLFYKDTDGFKIQIDSLNNIVECLNCKNEFNEKRVNLLEKIITYNLLNLEPNDKELYYILLNFNGNTEEFIGALSEGTPEEK